MRRKLTERLKTKIKEGKVKANDLQGEALTYFKRLKALEKARKAAQEKRHYFKVGNIKVMRGTEAYHDILTYSKKHGLTPKQYIKKHEDHLMKSFSKMYFPSPYQLEVLFDAISVMKDKDKFMINGNKISKGRLLITLDSGNQQMYLLTDAFKMIIEASFNMTNNGVNVYFPSLSEIQEVNTEDEFQSLMEAYRVQLIRSRAKHIAKFGNGE